ncbi:MAG: recombination regulator RecX [Gammaproteobacteria bacterium]|nr:recombination regulator RecX [Gammaproteobacteria bacterium]
MRSWKLKSKTERSAIEVAVGLLARREHSVLELERKLKQRYFDDAEIDQVLQKLQQKNLQSDERFTEAYVNMRRNRGYGPLRITNELRDRGIDTALSETYLSKSESDWLPVMQQQYIKKYGQQLAADYKEQIKRAKYLQNRGFYLDWVFKLTSIDEDPMIL